MRRRDVRPLPPIPGTPDGARGWPVGGTPPFVPVGPREPVDPDTPVPTVPPPGGPLVVTDTPPLGPYCLELEGRVCGTLRGLPLLGGAAESVCVVVANGVCLIVAAGLLSLVLVVGLSAMMMGDD